MRILIVDDHDFQRSLTLRLLNDLGEHDVAQARDGAEALEAARAQRPELVLSDLNMPGMDGMTFIRHLARERLTDSLVIISGLAPSVLRAVEAVAVASGLRVLGAVSKPIGKDTLASVLHLHRNPAGSSGADGELDVAEVERGIAMGQFKAWFSPILDLSALHVTGVEVNPRWESTERGILMGPDALAAVDALPAAPAVTRQVIQGALMGGALWRQLGWQGTIVVPLGLGALQDEGLLDWIQAKAKASGMAGGGLAVSLDAGAFAQDAARASYALARALLHGYPVTVHLRNATDLTALNLLTSCNTVTCPDTWVAVPDLFKRVVALARRVQADIGVTGLDNAQQLAALHDEKIHTAQGPGVGKPASAAETFDSHLISR
ncbi:MAG: response regulator [Gemmatimonadetes bacterium]|nr:response regulator [Gemmatimonadota bacterium]